jgi:sec-independent protein translocase protein TatB
MFGMGFTEILLIAVIAILFLGPDKLPSAMVDIAKFFRSVKQTIGSVKDSLEEEMNATGIKQEALAYKEELLKASEGLHKVTNVKNTIDAEIADILKENDAPKKIEEKPVTKAPTETQKVTFKKKKKKKVQNVPNVEEKEEKEEKTDV